SKKKYLSSLKETVSNDMKPNTMRAQIDEWVEEEWVEEFD
nr:hypothetical protein [Tanacetum cinerariifolium]